MAEIPMPEAGIPPTMAKSERPTGILCITCLMFLGGVINIGVGMFFSPVYVVLGIVNIIIAVFFYQLQYWAWMLTIILQVINMISSALTIILLPSALVNLFIILYLNKPEIKGLFQRETSGVQAW